MQRVASNSLGEVSAKDVEVSMPGSDGHLLGGKTEPEDAIEMVALGDLQTKKAAERLQKRMLMNNPVKAASKMVQCADEEEKKTRDVKGQVWAALKLRISAFEWMPRVTLTSLKSDLIAGLTVGVMVIPQSMSYANIAGLQYIYGMYAACVPTLIYAFFGQSAQLAVGPVAMVSLIVEAGLRGVLTEEQCPGWTEASGMQQYEVCFDEYASIAMLTAALVGAMQIVASLLRLGFLVSFLGHPVISGFTSGAAIIIGLSQLKYILGFNIEKSQFVYETVGSVLSNIGETKPLPVILGVTCLLYLIINKHVSRKYKKRLGMLGPVGPLIACVVGTVLLFCFPDLKEDFYVSYVGDIPSGLIPFSVGSWDMSMIPKVLPTALTSCLIGYMESIAIGKNLAAKHGYEIEAGQELLALGIANLVGAAFSGYPVTGSFSRSAVNDSTGSRSQLSGLVTAVMMFLTLLFLTPLFYYLPKFVLAAIVMSSVIPLVAYQEAIKLWRVERKDFLLWVVAFLGTLFLGVLAGILMAVGLSLVIVISESVRPQISILWRIPGTTIYRSMKQESSGTFIPNVFICRVGSSMYFANASFVRDVLMGFVSDIKDVNPTEYIILEMTPVISMDSTAAHLLHDLVHDFRKQGIQVGFAMVGNRAEKTMRKAGLKKFIGDHWFFCTVDDAVGYCLKHQQAKRKKNLSVEGSDVLSKAMSKEEEQAMVGMSAARPTNEVGFSNEIHHAWTSVFITVVGSSPELADAIQEIFRRNEVSVVRAQIDPMEEGAARHMYMVQSKATLNKLKDLDAQRIRGELLDAITSSTSTVGSETRSSEPASDERETEKTCLSV